MTDRVKPLRCEIFNPIVHKLTENNEPYYPEDYGPNLGYIVLGHVKDHPVFGYSHNFRTSLVTKYDKETGELETLNSRYKVRLNDE